MLKSTNLNIFTVDFPYGNEEPFLKSELDILSKHFDEIIIYPLHFKTKILKYELPSNVKVKHVDIFSAYNRLSVLRSHLVIVVSVFVKEIILSKNRWQYLSEFKYHLNTLLHRINASLSLSEFISTTTNNNLAYTYWFSQWTLVLSVLNHKHKNISLYTRIHGSDVYEEQHNSKRFFFPFRHFQCAQIKKVLSISENGKNHLLKQSPQFKNKIVVNRLGVLPHKISNSTKANEFTIVSCSSFLKYKRVELIVEILKRIDFNITWLHFGDSNERPLVENNLKNLPKNVSPILKGYISNSDLMEYYSGCTIDLFINVSETEGIPVSIMEAMSFGIPCIATNVGGVNEIVNDTNGYLIEKNFEIDAVATIIKKHKALNEKEKLNFREKAFKTWETNYNVNKNTNDLIKIFNNEN